MFCRDPAQPFPCCHQQSTGSPGLPKNCSWSNMEQQGKERRATEQLLNPFNLGNGLWIWQDGEDNNDNTHTWLQPGEAQNFPPGTLWGQMLGSTQPAVIPLLLLSGSWPQREPFPLPHPNITLCLWGTLPRHLLLLSTPSSPTLSLAANSHTRGAPKSPSLCPQKPRSFVPKSRAVSCWIWTVPQPLGPCWEVRCHQAGL